MRCNLFVRVAELGSFAGGRAATGRRPLGGDPADRRAGGASRRQADGAQHAAATLTSAGTAYLEKCRVILNLVEAAETDVAEERLTPRGNIRISLPLSFGLKRLAPLLLDFSQRYPEVALDMDYSDRRVNLIEEGIDLSIRVTRRLDAGDVARRIGTSRMLVLASPDYLSRHGQPAHPAELAHHVCLGYTNAGAATTWQFVVDGQLENFPIRSRINANNGDVLTEAAAQGLGIACQPDFIAGSFIAAGRVVEILVDYPGPELGIYAMLPSNRHVPHRVRVLMDFQREPFRRDRRHCLPGSGR